MKIQKSSVIKISDEAFIEIDVEPSYAFELVLGKSPGFEIKASEIDDAINLLTAGKKLRDKMLAENGEELAKGKKP